MLLATIETVEEGDWLYEQAQKQYKQGARYELQAKDPHTQDEDGDDLIKVWWFTDLKTARVAWLTLGRDRHAMYRLEPDGSIHVVDPDETTS